jgi:hypothetical protein
MRSLGKFRPYFLNNSWLLWSLYIPCAQKMKTNLSHMHNGRKRRRTSNIREHTVWSGKSLGFILFERPSVTLSLPRIKIWNLTVVRVSEMNVNEQVKLVVSFTAWNPRRSIISSVTSRISVCSRESKSRFVSPKWVQLLKQTSAYVSRF